LLADDPGLGKTFQAIRAADSRKAKQVAIICPASVIGTWHAEIRKYRTSDWYFFVTSYERACRQDYDHLTVNRWDALIIDEAHYLKTLTSGRTKAVYGFTAEDGLQRLPAIIDCADAVWLLSGTPMPNDPSELYPHLRALAPHLVTGERSGKIWSIFQFIAAFCETKNNGFGHKIVGARQEAKLHRKLEGFMLRRRKADVLKDLPPLRFGEVAVEGDLSALPPEEVAIVQKALERGGFDALKDVAGHVGKLRRLTGLAKLPATIAWLKDWLAGSTGKIVVFAYHKDVIAGLRDALGKQAVVLDGSTPVAQRQAVVDRFQQDPRVRVFIGQMTAAGVGITLTAASDMLVVESSWVPAEIQQATQRIHRIGQKESCLVRFAHVEGSIDEDIQRAVARKVRMIDAVIEGAT
jgi:SWI/SNF-related matrix-associated actin-dependent regulator of chromatin subfamily A-like protein 1